MKDNIIIQKKYDSIYKSIKDDIPEIKSFNFILVGFTGVGKSCLTNAILKKDLTKEGDSIKPETNNIESFSNDIHRVLLVGAGITNTTFCTHFPKIQENLQYFLSFLEHDYRPTPESIAADKAKASFIHKRMTYEDYLKWLHDDGLF